MSWQRTLVRNLAVLLVVIACGWPASAQTPMPEQQLNRMPSLPPPPFSRPMPERLAGTDPGRIVSWTLHDAIMAALVKNVDFEIERENVRLAQFDLLAARGAYDPVVSATVLYHAQNEPNSSPVSGSRQNFVRNDSLTYSFSISQAVSRAGGRYEISFDNERTTSNTSFFSTYFRPSLKVTFTQPLLRNFQIDDHRRRVKISKKRLDLSDAQFRQRAIEITSRVQQAYWDLASAIRDEEIQRDAVKLAETQLVNHRRQAEVGTLAPLDAVSAAAQLESSRQQAFQALNAVAQAENALKLLTVEGPASDLWSARIVPVEPFEVEPAVLPLSDAIKLALKNRPEVKQYELQQEINQVDVDYYRNQTKPQVDLSASYGPFGIGGTLAPETGGGAQPSQVPPRFIGGYGAALGNLFSQDFRSWRLGLTFSFPLRDRAAKANLGRALGTGRQLDLQARKQLQIIAAEVRNAVQSAEAARLRIAAARAARRYAEQQLEGEQKKFDAGLSTTFLLLTRQTELSRARGGELRALTDYNKAIAELQKAMSTTLSSNGIEVTSVGANQREP